MIVKRDRGTDKLNNIEFNERYIKREEYREEIVQFIKDNNIQSYAQLVDYARKNRPTDWFPLLCDCPRMFNKYMR